MATAKERNADQLERIEKLQTYLDALTPTDGPIELTAAISSGLRAGNPEAGNAPTAVLLQNFLVYLAQTLAADPPASEAPEAAWDRLLTKAEGLAGSSPAAGDLLLRIAIERRSRPRVKGGPVEGGVTMNVSPPPGSAVAAAHAAALRSPADVIRPRG